jgi:hypothetical protein
MEKKLLTTVKRGKLWNLANTESLPGKHVNNIVVRSRLLIQVVPAKDLREHLSHIICKHNTIPRFAKKVSRFPVKPLVSEAQVSSALARTLVASV